MKKAICSECLSNRHNNCMCREECDCLCNGDEWWKKNMKKDTNGFNIYESTKAEMEQYCHPEPTDRHGNPYLKSFRLYCNHEGCTKYIKGKYGGGYGGFIAETGQDCDLRNQCWFCDRHSITFPVIKNVELHLVGGCVRDLLLEKVNKDRDFVMLTNLKYDTVVKNIESMPGCKVYLAKKEFLTIRAKIGDEVVDLVFPRSEQGYLDGRRPSKVKRLKTLRADAVRRDFTINSMYMDSNSNIIDYFGGQNDLKSKIIRTVGSPDRRFKEDYLRIIRAVRFAIQLGFKIDKATYSAMKKHAHNLRRISADRLRDELNKAMFVDPYKTITFVKKLGIVDILHDAGLKFVATSKQYGGV